VGEVLLKDGCPSDVLLKARPRECEYTLRGAGKFQNSAVKSGNELTGMDRMDRIGI
jgi:hypothetical protein